MFIKSIIVLLICVLIAFYVHEYHGSTVNNVIKTLPVLDTTATSLYALLLKCYELFHNPPQSKKDNDLLNERLFTAEELRKYTSENTGFYLAILGKVYDVSEGKKFYGPEGSYRFFTGRDGSRAFVTGDFTESGLTDDVIDLPEEDLKGLYKWIKVYDQQYKYKGKLVGRYYNNEGAPTNYFIALEEKLRLAELVAAAAEKEKLLLPPCNVEWSKEAGSRVWCTKLSGGIKRDWVGVPRKLYEPGSETYRCACVNMDSDYVHSKGNLREYTDCHPKSTSCDVHED